MDSSILNKLSPQNDQNNTDAGPNSTIERGRSRSIPRPPAMAPPPIPGRSSSPAAASKRNDNLNSLLNNLTNEITQGAEKNETRRLPRGLRSHSTPAVNRTGESPTLPPRDRIPSVSQSNDDSVRKKAGQKRSVSFTRDRGNGHSRTPTSSSGKGILKNTQMVSSPMILDSPLSFSASPSKPKRTPKKSTSASGSIQKESPVTGSPELDDSQNTRGRSRSTRQGSKRKSKDLPATPKPETADSVVPQSPAKNETIPDKAIPKDLFDRLGKKPEEFKDHIMSIMVHEADPLPTDVHVRNPLVRVSFIDANTGKYVAKSKADRKATSANESHHLFVVLPCLTKTYCIPEHKKKSPKWEEQIVINEDYLHLLKDNIIVCFEILDFVTNKRFLAGNTDGWYKVAWAFLKLVGGDHTTNTESRIRLQLYQYPTWAFNGLMRDKTIPSVYHAYKSRHVKHPGSLHVTLSGIPKPEIRQVRSRSRLPTEIEVGKLTLEQLLKGQNTRQKAQIGSRSILNLASTKIWRYEKGQRFKLPNKLLYSFDSGSRGAFACCFSNSGLYLAIACIGLKTHPIKVYDVLTGERVATLEGHQDLVYQLSWSSDDSNLISASSDATVRSWNFDTDGSVRLRATLSHPSFVYTASFHPGFSNEMKMVITGSYDGTLRVWAFNIETKEAPKCLQKIVAHNLYINSLVFDESGDKLYTAHASGLIKVFDSSLDENKQVNLKCISTVDIFMGITINCLSLSASSRKLLVHTASNTLHILDTRIHKILLNIDPLPVTYLNRSSAMSPFLPPLPNPTPSLFKRSKFSPCGSFIMSGNTIYNVDSGKKVAQYKGLEMVVDVAWHPLDFTSCVVEYGNCGVAMYSFDAKTPPLKCPDPVTLETTTPRIANFMSESPKQLSRQVSVDKKDSEALPSAFYNALESLKLGRDLNNKQPRALMASYKGVEAKTVGI